MYHKHQIKKSSSHLQRVRGYLRDYLPILDPCNQREFDWILPIHEIGSHLYDLSKTGSGKTECLKLIFVRLVLKADGNIVIFDPHGDFAMQCAKMMNHHKDIIYIDPFLKKWLTPTINPFRNKDSSEETIETISTEILNAFENIIGTEFSPNMEALLTPCTYTLVRKGDSGVDELLVLMDDEKNEELINLGLKSPIKAHRDFFKNQFKKRKFTRTKDALATKLQILLNNPTFTNLITGKSTFDLEKALNSKNKIIIFRFPKGKMRKTLEPAAKLIMALIQGIVFKRASMLEDIRPKTYLICDEYQNFFSQVSDEMLSESRKNNLSVICAHQNLSQIDGKSRDNIMSGANIKIVGMNSSKDLKVMSEEIEVDIQALKDLQKGEFFIKNGSNEAVKIITSTKYLGNKCSISNAQWEKHLKYQKKHYYKSVNVNEEETQTSFNDVKTDNSDHGSLPIPEFDDID